MQKVGLLKSLKKPVSEHLWAVNMLKAPKHCLNVHGNILSDFSITMKENELEKIRVSIIWNHETVC